MAEEKIQPSLVTELWELRKSIMRLASDPFRSPDLDGYASEVFEQVVGVKELANKLLSQTNNLQIEGVLVNLTKLYRDVEGIRNKLIYITNPPCPDNTYSPQESDKLVKENDKTFKKTIKELGEELSEFKEKYDSTLEDLTAKLEVEIEYPALKEQAKQSGVEQGESDKNKEQPWRDDAPEYITNTEATKLTDGKLSLSRLSKILTPEGQIRYMRKGQRCQVHLQDFRAYAKMLGEDMFSERAFEAYFKQTEACKEQIDQGKRATGK